MLFRGKINSHRADSNEMYIPRWPLNKAKLGYQNWRNDVKCSLKVS